MSEFARKQVVDAALSIVGLSADPASVDSRKQFLDLIAPGETPAMAADMAKMSTCGLVVGGIWRMAGLKHPKLDPPYKIGYAIERLLEIGREFNAWNPASPGKFPNPGDMMMVGDDHAGGYTHVYTVITVDTNSMIITSVDGGQVDARFFQTAIEKHRTWRNGKDVVFAGTDPGSAVVGGRVLDGWIDVSLLPFEEAQAIYGS